MSPSRPSLADAVKAGLSGQELKVATLTGTVVARDNDEIKFTDPDAVPANADITVGEIQKRALERMRLNTTSSGNGSEMPN